MQSALPTKIGRCLNYWAEGLRDVLVQVSSNTQSDMIPCTGRPDSDQECNALIPQLHAHNYLLGRVACDYRADGVAVITLS